MNKGFFDNDILIKLAGCGLAEEVCQQLEIGETWVLPSLKVQLSPSRKSGKLARQFASFPKETQADILKYVSRCLVLSPPKAHDFIERHIQEQNLDTGELQLLEASLRKKDSFLLTGDKRFLKGVMGHTGLCRTALEKLPGRFACLESILLLLIDRLGFDFVSSHVLPFREHDGQIRIAFSRAGTEKKAREALCYELKRLGKEAAKLLHYYP